MAAAVGPQLEIGTNSHGLHPDDLPQAHFWAVGLGPEMPDPPMRELKLLSLCVGVFPIRGMWFQPHQLDAVEVPHHQLLLGPLPSTRTPPGLDLVNEIGRRVVWPDGRHLELGGTLRHESDQVHDQRQRPANVRHRRLVVSNLLQVVETGDIAPPNWLDFAVDLDLVLVLRSRGIFPDGAEVLGDR
ncbi:hypothetical protein D3C71_1520060 [compost metagenome]